jgi:hypothetical protein
MTKPKTTSLVGLWLVLDSPDHQSFRIGRIVTAVGDSFLIQLETLEANHPGVSPMELATAEELSAVCPSGIKLVSLFKTRDDMTAWIDWVTTPEKPARQTGSKIVQIKPH